MEDFKPNSERSKQITPGEKVPEKKYEKVVSGPVRVQKKGAFRRMLESFIVKDVGDIKEHVFMDVMLPAAKNTIIDVVSMLLNGTTRTNRAGSGVRAPYVSYESKYSTKPTVDPRAPIRVGFNYDDLVFNTLGDAKEVLDKMSEVIETYGIISVFDLYDMSGVPDNPYTNNKYGWSNLTGTDIIHTRDGFVLKLPKPMPIT